MRLRFSFLLLFTPLLTACDDDLNADWTAVPDTVLLYSLSRPELLGKPSAFDFFDGVPISVESPAASGRWDLALIDLNGELALVPASAFVGVVSRAGVATVSARTLEEVTEAPGDTAQFKSEPVVIRVGTIYVVRTRRTDCGFGSGVRYAKLEPLEVNTTAGTLRFRSIVNPYCNDRKLIPPE
jgi:hypothetical protein